MNKASFSKANLAKVAKKFTPILKERFVGTEIRLTSIVIAYYLLLSIFPLVIVIGNLLPLFGVNPTTTLSYLDTVIPPQAIDIIHPLVEGLLSPTNGSLLSIGALVAVWSSAKGVSHLRRGMNKAYGIPDSTNFIVKRLLSIITILLIILLLIAFLLLFSFGELLASIFERRIPWLSYIISWVFELKFLVAVGFLFCMLLLVYRTTPAVKLKLRHVIPGAAFATAGLLLLVQAFTLYIHFSTRIWSGYGALSTVIVLIFWLNLSALIVLLGAVLNASISEYRFGKAEREQYGVDIALRRTKQNLVSYLICWNKRRKAKKSQAGSSAQKECTPPPAPRGEDAQSTPPQKNKEQTPS